MSPTKALPSGAGFTAPSAIDSSTPLAQANAALQNGEADKALAGLASGQDSASIHNLICRVRFALEQWDAAASECQRAVQLDRQNSEFHMWLARCLGEKAASASFLTAFSLAKQSRSEFEESVRLDPRNVAALADLGDFYRQAPGIVGGGTDRAAQIASQLEKLDAAQGHHLRARIAEEHKDFGTAERELKQAIAVSAHSALEWTGLASFYRRQTRFNEMEVAVRSALAGALRDKNAAVAFYDGAGILIEANRAPDLAVTLLEDYLSSPNKKEEAPAFVAHLRLARLKARLGDRQGAEQERTAALAMAREYKPAKEFKPSDSNNQELKH